MTPNKNKTLSLSIVPGGGTQAKKKGVEAKGGADPEDISFKFHGNSGMQLSSVIKAEETEQSQNDIFDVKAPEGENGDRNKIRTTRQMDKGGQQ